MTQEEKSLLLKDLCARLPYGVICRQNAISVDGEPFTIDRYISIIQLEKCISLDDVEVPFRPYLRPMLSMTEEEKKEFQEIKLSYFFDEDSYILLDWLNKKMFAYRTIDGKNMFELGLALEAPEGMY